MNSWIIYFALLVYSTIVLWMLMTAFRYENKAYVPINTTPVTLFFMLGAIVTITQVIISFWHLKWWVSLAVLVGSIVCGVILMFVTSPLLFNYQRYGFGRAWWLGIFGVLTFGVLSFIKLFAV